MRHLFVTNDFPPKLGGIESYLTSLCSGLDPDDVTVIAPAREGHEEADEALPYSVVRLGGTYLRAKREVRDAIVETVEDREPDVVHYLAALPLGRTGRKVRNATDRPYTVFAHGTGEVLLPSRLPFARRALVRVLREADLVFPVSSFTEEAVVKICDGDVVTSVLNPAVDAERFSLDVSGAAVRQQHHVGGRFLVLFVSRLVKRKGAEVLVRAVADLDDVTALIVGSGPEARTLERLAHELGCEDRVIFAGRVDDADLPSFYAAGDVFCMPCSDRLGGLDTEGFGIVYLEAQASGLPVIAGRCGGSVEAVDDGVTGYVLDDPTAEDVAGVIAELRDDELGRVKMGGAGRARIERGFTPEVIATRFEDALGHVLE